MPDSDPRIVRANKQAAKFRIRAREAEAAQKEAEQKLEDAYLLLGIYQQAARDMIKS